MNNTEDQAEVNGSQPFAEAPCSARRVFSLPLSDHALADFVEQQGAKHRKGVAGYLRHLVTIDREKWLDMAQLRELALSKLTDNERAALGYPPNTGPPSSASTRKPARGHFSDGQTRPPEALSRAGIP